MHYVAHTEETTLTGGCDERLKRLHEKMDEIKSNVEVGVMYMKMEERDRLIEERGRLAGRTEGITEGRMEELLSKIQKKIRRGKSLAETAEDLEETPEDIRILYTMALENQEKTPEDILKLLK